VRTLTCGYASLSVTAGYSSSTTKSSQQSINQITEATKKSAHSLKTLYKIEVRGVSESLIQNRMTRIIKNPYNDRTLSLNIFQLIKHFSVKTSLVEIRPALIIQVNGLYFDNEFVVSNSDFLQNNLLDQSLIDELPTSIQGAAPVASTGALQAASDAANLALKYFFDVPNMFNIPHPPQFPDPNLPSNSFDVSASGGSIPSGLVESIHSKWEMMFTGLNFFYKLYSDRWGTPDLDKYAISIALAIANATVTFLLFIIFTPIHSHLLVTCTAWIVSILSHCIAQV
jgi:hypothetical protein